MVRRILAGLKEAGIEEVLYMPDSYAIVERALTDLPEARRPASIAPLVYWQHNNQEDTVNAARMLEEAGAGLMIVLGGDGTARAACKGSRKLPILALSTGTNNVFPVMTEATMAGLAAGVLASGAIPMEAGCLEADILEIVVNGECVDMALVDVAVAREAFVERKVRAAIAPGLFVEAGIVSQQTMTRGTSFPVQQPAVLALDGEREVVLRKKDEAYVRLAQRGVQVVDVARTLEEARRKRVFVRG